MHIDPGVVTGGKLVFSYMTAASIGAVALVSLAGVVRREGFGPPVLRSALASACVLSFFELLPHWPVGVSEVHLILGSTLFLIFGTAPAAVGLAGGLLLQGILFAPFDLPQYGMNVTILLAPLFGLAMLARRILAPSTAYSQSRYSQVLVLSLCYQGGVVVWVAFWALLGQGLTGENLVRIGVFGTSYLLVVAIEPFIDLAVLAIAKAARDFESTRLAARPVRILE